jgi:hypothetical protein
MAPRKSHPKGIDPAFPQKNFVEASFLNKGEKDEFRDYMYGTYNINLEKFVTDDDRNQKKPSGFGHSIGQRAGKLRYSGTKGAHRIGKR